MLVGETLLTRYYALDHMLLQLTLEKTRFDSFISQLSVVTGPEADLDLYSSSPAICTAITLLIRGSCNDSQGGSGLLRVTLVVGRPHPIPPSCSSRLRPVRIRSLDGSLRVWKFLSGFANDPV